MGEKRSGEKGRRKKHESTNGHHRRERTSRSSRHKTYHSHNSESDEYDDIESYSSLNSKDSLFTAIFAVLRWIGDRISDGSRASFLRNTAVIVILYVVIQELLSESASKADSRSMNSDFSPKYQLSTGDADDLTSSSSTSLDGTSPDGVGAMAMPDYLAQLRGSSSNTVVRRRPNGELDDDTNNDDIFEAGRAVTGTSAFPENEANDKTTRLAQIFAGIVIHYNISSVADLTCRWTAPWISVVHFQILAVKPDYKYYCIDNNPQSLHALLQQFPQFRSVFFLRRHVWDPKFIKLPVVDMYFSMDGFQRQSYDRLEKSFENLRLNARPKYVLFTVNPNRKNPSRNSIYKFSRLDFHSEPFLFPDPLRRFSDLTNDPTHLSNPKQLSLWNLADIDYPKGLEIPALTTPPSAENTSTNATASDVTQKPAEGTEGGGALPLDASGQSMLIGGATTIDREDSSALQGSTEQKSQFSLGDAARRAKSEAESSSASDASAASNIQSSERLAAPSAPPNVPQPPIEPITAAAAPAA